jgi:putative nucleotidyltransferase with HDIG domain
MRVDGRLDTRTRDPTALTSPLEDVDVAVPTARHPHSDGAYDLIGIVQRLSLARSLPEIQEIVRRGARNLTGADGATFVLRDGEQCFYADEDAIEPLWKGQRFPLSQCISGWAMLNRRSVAIENIYEDDRIPHSAYRPTFVRSLAMVPIRTLEPVGAIGNYWASRHRPSESDLELLQALADSTAVAIENVRVYQELEAARTETLLCLARAAEYRDDATHQHTERVARLAARLASELGSTSAEVELIRVAAPLHDIGKLAIPDSVLLKAGALSPEEFERVKVHAEAGAAILAGTTSDVLRLGQEIARTHHEWWDGTGYPHGLAGEAIARSGRIVALADVFDALTNPRPYKRAWPLADALAELQRLRGRQFDPAVVDAFMRLPTPGKLPTWSS